MKCVYMRKFNSRIHFFVAGGAVRETEQLGELFVLQCKYSHLSHTNAAVREEYDSGERFKPQRDIKIVYW